MFGSYDQGFIGGQLHRKPNILSVRGLFSPQTARNMAATELTLSRCLALAFLWLLLSYGHSFEMECIEVKRAYIEKGFGETDVPIRAIPGE